MKGKKTGGRSKGVPNKPRVSYELSEYLKNFTGVIKGDSFYVYKHILGENVFYIGKGKGDRAWDKSRNDKWAEFVRINPNYEVRIIAMGLTESEALIIERQLIMHHLPDCNIVYNNGQLTFL